MKSIVIRLLVVSLALLTACAQHANDKSASADPTSGGYKENPDSQKIKRDLLRVNYVAGDVARMCDGSLAKFTDVLAKEIKSAYDLDRAYSEMTDEVTPLFFMGYVHADENVRAEASHCEERYNKALVDMFTHKNIYEIVKASQAQSPDDDRLISEFKRNFEKNGMQLNVAEMADYRDLKSQLVTLEAQFTKNLNENSATVEFSENDLEGLPKSFFERLKKNATGLFIVTTKSTDYIQVMENAKKPDTRRKMQFAYENVAAEANTSILEKAIQLREKIALRLGVKTWADYRIKGNMAKSGDQAQAFLLDLKKRLKPRLKSDLAILLDAKKRMEDPKATELKAWDIRYFESQVKKQDYALDEEELRKYLPKDTVMAGIFDIYSTLLGVKFEEVKDAVVWGPEVKLYSIRDRETRQIVGYFYTDFVPRTGKYGHAAAFPLILGRQMAGGFYAQPISAIVANFTPPANGKPSLMVHREVETVFHEFGHIMHQTLTRVPYGFLSGSAVAQDFVEAPSQMLENWVWEPAILKKISGLYSDSSQKLPDDLITKIVATRDFNKGYYYSRQLTLGLTDLSMHTSKGGVDVTDLYRRTHKDVIGIPAIEGSHFCASFGHLMGGYDAGYYGYLWSEVFAADMFTAFQNEGLLSSKIGERYRTTILEQGNMLDAVDLLAEFLGRQPNNQAFLKKLKIL